MVPAILQRKRRSLPNGPQPNRLRARFRNGWRAFRFAFLGAESDVTLSGSSIRSISWWIIRPASLGRPGVGWGIFKFRLQASVRKTSESDRGSRGGLRQFIVHLGIFGDGRSTDPHFAWHEI